ncbi:hypothetical protein D9619_011249 [Psilocybe cf. subviscida]|uniref:Uncharacterized protein n=1 Tax=Psilocybe cf. subviscida TaxID=2480587 RepID=A0A8H5BKZ3_9AGAR|nr:hypothetical protein D9619_011249 [Psilocybe cf. subviscida]
MRSNYTRESGSDRVWCLSWDSHSTSICLCTFALALDPRQAVPTPVMPTPIPTPTLYRILPWIGRCPIVPEWHDQDTGGAPRLLYVQRMGLSEYRRAHNSPNETGFDQGV